MKMMPSWCGMQRLTKWQKHDKTRKGKTMAYALETWNRYTNSWYSKRTFKSKREAKQWQHDEAIGLPEWLKPKTRVVKI